MFATSAGAGTTQDICGIAPGLGSFQAELKVLIGNVDPTRGQTIADTQPSVADLQAFANGKQAPIDAVYANQPYDPAVADAWATASTGFQGILDQFQVAGYNLASLPPSTVQQLVDGANGTVLPGTPINADVVNAQAAFDGFFQAYCPAAPPTNVVSVPSAGAGGGSVAITSPTGTTLSGVSASPVAGSPVPPPSGAQFPAGVLGFTVSGVTPGGTADVTITMPPGSNPNGYFKLQGGVWVDFSSHVTIVGDVITLHLQDGDAFDTNPAPGVIGDPGAAAVVEKTPPTVQCPVTPTYLLHQPNPTLTATVTDAGSGPVSPTVAVAVNTATVGAHTVDVTAADRAGNHATAPCAYTVRYRFAGFGPPVANDSVNTAKAGKSIPLSWWIGDYYYAPVTSNASFVSASSATSTCATSPTHSIGLYTAGTGLRSIGGGVWLYEWKTPTSYNGQCRVFQIALADGTSHTAQFLFK